MKIIFLFQVILSFANANNIIRILELKIFIPNLSKWSAFFECQVSRYESPGGHCNIKVLCKTLQKNEQEFLIQRNYSQ